MRCSNSKYELLHPYYYPNNHTQAGVTSAGPHVSGYDPPVLKTLLRLCIACRTESRLSPDTAGPPGSASLTSFPISSPYTPSAPVAPGFCPSLALPSSFLPQGLHVHWLLHLELSSHPTLFRPHSPSLVTLCRTIPPVSLRNHFSF